jgi:hypothetical protein
MSLASHFINFTITRVSYYKALGDKTFEQLNEQDFHFMPNAESNSIAIIIQHMAGNMLSRWTNFLTTDGEKEWRNRDTEFEEQPLNKEQLLVLWNKGWDCYLGALQSLTEEDLLKTITIRTEPLLVVDAIQRQMAHYPYHVGQIVYLGRLIKQQDWKSLSIPKGNSQQFNDGMKR